MADPPTAIFAASETQAIGVLAAANRLGVRVPHELSVIGFDDIERASLLRQVLAIEVVQRGSSGRSAGQSRQTSCRSGSHSSLNSALEAR